MEELNRLTPDEGTPNGEAEITPAQEYDFSEAGEAKETSQVLEETPEIDYKQKFAESTREAQLLASKIKHLENKINSSLSSEVPAEKELKDLYPDWDNLGELERRLAVQTVTFGKRLNKVEQTFNSLKEETEWNKELNRFLEKSRVLDTYADIHNREKEFRAFAQKPTHKGIALDVLAKAFLFDEIETGTPVKRKPVLESGSSGIKTTTNQKKITAEELSALRKNDYKKYTDLITRHPDWIPTDF